jgi:uncharacterized membrane protein YphA (DoxX/SURF4 family)
MITDTSPVRIACVLLRASLAAVFLWHGSDKLLGPDNEWGANWVSRFQARESRPPARALEKLEHLPTAAWLNDDEANKLQAKLEKADDAETEKLKKEADVTADRRRRLTADRLRRAYAADDPATIPTFSFAVQYAVAWGEVVGGVLLLLGLLTRLAALAMVVIQLGAIYFVTGPFGMMRGPGVGYEYNLCLVVMCLCLVIMGGGGWSIDHFLHWGRGGSEKTTARPSPTESVTAARVS